MSNTELLAWTRWLARHARESGPLTRDEIVYSTPGWKEVWASEIQQAAERREEIPLPVVRSYARHVSKAGAVRNLRAAANADAIAFALRPKEAK